jgi:hypothetical protein
MKYNDINLEKAFYYVQTALNREGLNPQNATLDSTEMFANEIVYRLKYELAKQSEITKIKKYFKQKLNQPLTIKTQRPTSVWQMFKEQYMPKWFIKKYPIKYNYAFRDDKTEIEVNLEVEVGLDVIYPKIVLHQDHYTANFRFMDRNKFTVQRKTIEV